MRTETILAAILTVLAVASCTKNKRPQPAMGWTAQNEVDRICGDYVLEQVRWDGAPVDLDGDGIANPSLLDELQSGPWLGVKSDKAFIQPALQLDSPAQINAFVYYGDYADDNKGGYSANDISFYYTINYEGVVTYDVSQIVISGYNGYGNYRFDNISVAFEDVLLAISGDTDFFDMRTLSVVSGRETLLFRCISTKEKQ